MQQQLMVAALTCDDVPLYNSFVTAYQQELITSDEALQAFFDRFGDQAGGSAYHSFKTKMANVYSARSAADKKTFCASARASFAPVLKSEKVSLARFAMSQPSSVNEAYTNCGDSVAGGAMVARTPVSAPPPPPSNLLTAQNEAAEAKAAAAAPSPSEDKPLSAALRANQAPATAPATAGSAVAAAGANAAPPPPSVPNSARANATPPPATNPNATRSPYYQGYGPGYARERERQRTAEDPTTEYQGAGNAPNAGGAFANSNPYPERNASGSTQRGYASDAYRERLAQQRATRQRAAQRPGVTFRDRYDARGYYWPADPYWQYCYTRYGVRLSCAEAAERYRADRYYYRAPYDPWSYPIR